ncbi:MAG: transposase [candidate division Zixibacteria bacterium]|jgi:transposase|nr:transposase [candidate division Zixibacteria bacterium]
MVERRRQYNRQFKEQAVRLLQAGEVPLAQVARQLGVSESMLRRWRNQVLSGRSFSASGRQERTLIQRLQRENQQLKRDMAALKKTLGVLERDRR